MPKMLDVTLMAKDIEVLVNCLCVITPEHFTQATGEAANKRRELMDYLHDKLEEAY